MMCGEIQRVCRAVTKHRIRFAPAIFLDNDTLFLWNPANMDVQAHLSVLLKQMGDSADAVGDMLIAQKIQGVRHTVRFLNPIVRYLQRDLRVDDLRLDVMQGDRVTLTTASRTAETAMPTAVVQFLEAFNRGEYPACELPLDAQ